MATLDTITGAKVKTYSVTGPASYATGGFAHDASADFSWIGFVDVTTTTQGSLTAFDYEMDLNVDTAGAEALGKSVIKVVRKRFDNPSIGNVSGQPGGVTVQASQTSTASTTGSSHTHATTHDHASANTGAPTISGTGENTAAGGPGMNAHDHAVDFPNLIAASGTATHSHVRSFEYDHIHSITQATTDLAATEVANATDLSTTTFKIAVYGFGKA